MGLCPQTHKKQAEFLTPPVRFVSPATCSLGPNCLRGLRERWSSGALWKLVPKGRLHAATQGLPWTDFPRAFMWATKDPGREREVVQQPCRLCAQGLHAGWTPKHVLSHPCRASSALGSNANWRNLPAVPVRAAVPAVATVTTLSTGTCKDHTVPTVSAVSTMKSGGARDVALPAVSGNFYLPAMIRSKSLLC